MGFARLDLNRAELTASAGNEIVSTVLDGSRCLDTMSEQAELNQEFAQRPPANFLAAMDFP